MNRPERKGDHGGFTRAQVAQHLGLTVEQVKWIERQALRKLRRSRLRYWAGHEGYSKGEITNDGIRDYRNRFIGQHDLVSDL